METYSFKHIFLALVLAFLCSLSLPAAAVECQMQSHGQMVCNDGNVYQVQALPSANTVPAVPATEPRFSPKEWSAMQGLAAVESSDGQGLLLMSFITAIIVIVAVFFVIKGHMSSNWTMKTGGLMLVVFCTPFYINFAMKAAHHYADSSPEQKIAIERQRMEMEQMRAIRDNAIRREAQRFNGNPSQ